MDSEKKMIATKDLSGPVLSWYAARLVGHDPVFRVTGQLVEAVYRMGEREQVFDPDLNGADAMRLIEIHRIQIATVGAGWCAYPMGQTYVDSVQAHYHKNIGVAVARCVVACKLGAEVAYPVELDEALADAARSKPLNREASWGVQWEKFPSFEPSHKSSGMSI